MADPFTIRIFVPDGDPEGVRLIDRMNWTGLGIVFPRGKWPEARGRPEFARTGVYILVGYKDQGDDLPTLYIGQADGVRNRIDSHFQAKEFWDRGVVFVSGNNGLNRAHVTWLEYALIRRSREVGRSRPDNGNVPQEPGLSESEKADTRGFLKEILQILPLVGLRAFEIPKAVAVPASPPTPGPAPKAKHEKDTVIVPAQKDGFERVFLGEDRWRAIRVSGCRLRFSGCSHPRSAAGHALPLTEDRPRSRVSGGSRAHPGNVE